MTDLITEARGLLGVMTADIADDGYFECREAERNTIKMLCDALEKADAELGRCVVLPCKVGDTVDGLFSHNEIIAIWEEHKNEEASPKYMLWKGMAHALPMEYQARVFVRIFGTIPESIMDADTVNILVTPCITPRAEAEAALKEVAKNERQHKTV